MLTRSANASPTIHGFHYAPLHSARYSPSRNSAAAAAATPTLRRPSSASSLVSASAAATSAVATSSVAASIASSPSSAALSHSRPATPLAAPLSGPQSSSSPAAPRYVAVDAATQYSPMEPFDYAAHPRHQHAPSPLPGPSSVLQPLSAHSTPREAPPTPRPAPMEPGIEQGVDHSSTAAAATTTAVAGSSTHRLYHQVDGPQEQPPPPHTFQEQEPIPQGMPVPGPPATMPAASFSNNHPPSAADVAPPPATASSSAQKGQSAYKSSPQKRRSSQGPNPDEDPVDESSVTAAAEEAPSDEAAEAAAGSAKRSRPEAAPPKLLPELYEFCPVEDMVVLIVNMLGELIETNDALAFKSGHLTRFHSRTAPGISVLDYLHRLAKHATLTPPLLLSMVYYIDRLCAMYPDFTINTLTVHRFLITAATVASKGLSDSFWNNTTYARVGGVRVAELKMLELEFLYRLEWKIVPNPEVLAAYYRPLVDRCPGYALPPESRTPREPEDDFARDDAKHGTAHAGASGALANSHNRQSSTNLIGEDLVVSTMTQKSGR